MTRKLIDSASDSSLSPFPDNVETPSTADAVESSSGKKRKAVATAKTTKKRKTAVKAEDAADEEVEKPKKRARKVKVEEETVEYVSRQQTSRTRTGLECSVWTSSGLGLLTMVLHRREVKVEENGATTKVKTTQKRKKKAEDAAPLEERTQGSKLRVGAHVSIAGGKSPSSPPLSKREGEWLTQNGRA